MPTRERPADEHQATARLLYGAPIGLPDGTVVCDSCNATIADCYEETKTYVETVYVYVTQDPHTNRWYLRWCNCDDCGAIGSDEITELGELHATAPHASERLLALRRVRRHR